MQILKYLFQFYDVAPPCGGVFAFVIVLDGVGKDVGLAFSVLLGVLQISGVKSAGSVLVIIIPRQYFKDRELIWHDKIERVVFRVVRIS